MIKKNYVIFLALWAVLVSTAFAQDIDQGECDPEFQDCSQQGSIKEPNKTIYPYKPFETGYFTERLNALHEGENYISSVFEMEKKNLNRADTKVQPWGGPFWPLFQGQIGNTYQDKDYNTFILSIRRNLDWKKNVKDFKKRAQEVHPKIYDLSEEELAKLAPSEKYDLLLGDTSFDLTNRIWAFAEKWGSEKKWAFLSAINIPDGYRIPKANTMMALWEGICHGWAVAAGHTERPQNTVTVTLPNGKRMPFYPNDIKALISLMWANSTIQSNVIFEGNRCNKKYPDKDKNGRYIDVVKDRDDMTLIPRCADVHPGIFHVSLVNILGVEGRSFIVDKAAEAAVANQPVSGYELYYFNPRTGKEGPLSDSVLSREAYGNQDPFKVSRNPESTHIVGVEVKLKYTDWEYPKAKATNGVADDKIKDFSFTYDLELTAQGRVVGGQWRVGRKGGPGVFETKTQQPDFFWVVPRDWKNYFKPITGLPSWNFAESTLPPKEFQSAARGAHSFIYEESKRFFSEGPKCPVFPVTGGEPIKVECEFRHPRPQPLINVVEKLLEESRK
jgi:hypothetical protein